VTSSLAVFEAAMGKSNVYDKIMIENQRTKENMEIKILNIKLHLIDGLRMELTAC